MKGIVEGLIRRYDTRNPFDIAEAIGVILLKAPLTDNVKGLYRFWQRRKIIIVNSDLSEEEQRIVCAHELGHAVLHKKVNAVFLSRCTLLSTDRYETEANRFASLLLISDEFVNAYKELSIPQLQLFTGFDEDTIRYRFNN